MALAVRQEAEPALAERLQEGRRELQDLKSEAGEIAVGLGRIARDEALLAVSEVKDGVRATVRAGVWSGVAVVLAVITLVWLPLPLFIGLAEVVPWWAAALITLGVLATLTLTVGYVALQRLKNIRFVPREAIDRIKEDQRWLKQQLSERHG